MNNVDISFQEELGATKRHYHSYSSDSNELRVVIRGISTTVAQANKIKKNIEGQGFKSNSVHVMHSRPGPRQQIPLFLVKTPKERQEALMNISVCTGLAINAKKQRIHTDPKQCYRCLQYWHIRQHCHIQVLCVKCGGNNIPTQLPKRLTAHCITRTAILLDIKDAKKYRS